MRREGRTCCTTLRACSSSHHPNPVVSRCSFDSANGNLSHCGLEVSSQCRPTSFPRVEAQSRACLLQESICPSSQAGLESRRLGTERPFWLECLTGGDDASQTLVLPEVASWRMESCCKAEALALPAHLAAWSSTGCHGHNAALVDSAAEWMATVAASAAPSGMRRLEAVAEGAVQQGHQLWRSASHSTYHTSLAQ
jgi:hypothetical protein